MTNYPITYRNPNPTPTEKRDWDIADALLDALRARLADENAITLYQVDLLGFCRAVAPTVGAMIDAGPAVGRDLALERLASEKFAAQQQRDRDSAELQRAYAELYGRRAS